MVAMLSLLHYHISKIWFHYYVFPTEVTLVMHACSSYVRSCTGRYAQKSVPEKSYNTCIIYFLDLLCFKRDMFYYSIEYINLKPIGSDGSSIHS